MTNGIPPAAQPHRQGTARELVCSQQIEQRRAWRMRALPYFSVQVAGTP